LRLGKEDEANVAIEQGLAMNADDPNLLWARASVLEQDNRIDEAIAIYEQLYDSTSNSIIVANNLASLLSARREDQESLDRAFTVARRFKDTETPALQDTYGWILHRMGDSEEALPYLESAAAALTRDALTQFHLAMTYIALGQTSDAVTQLQKTIDVAGPADTRSQIETARKELARLQTESQ
jgi:tetratricopeptide (TPR) repeat protein